MRAAWFLLLCSVLIAASGCPGDPVEEPGCPPGGIVACTCGDGRSGLARCSADGLGTDPCNCGAPPVDAVAPPDPGGQPDLPPTGPDAGDCLPRCDSRVCGGDGCGGTCGATCPDGMACAPDGTRCVKFCAGTVCEDGTCCDKACCGGACCDEGAACLNGACCQPDCFGRQCGGDRCGGTCGTCGPGCACTLAGACDCCVDECPQEGRRECYAQGWRQCGNFDADACREWSAPTACGVAGCDDATGTCIGCAAECEGRDCGWVGNCFCGSCDGCGECSNGQCLATPHASAGCHDGDLEWRDACGAWEGVLKQSCACDCVNDTCDDSSCTAGQVRCNGANRERCLGGCSWDFVDTCECGCQGGQCLPCTPTQATIQFVLPTCSTCTNPVSFRVQTTGAVARVRYAADGWEFGSSTDAAGGFPRTYTFTTLGVRSVVATAEDAAGTALATASRTITVTQAPVTGANKLGAWVWYIEGTGYTYQALAVKLAGLGVRRVYLKLGDGSNTWTEAYDSSIPPIFHDEGLEVWGWSFNYPGNEADQAGTLYEAAKAGYDGFVLDLESEFDGSTTGLRAVLEAFAAARSDARVDGYAGPTWPMYVTTWGNPADHDMHVEIIDQYADAHMPQTYVELWGATAMANAADWVQDGTCEYRSLGANKPVHHIVSTENNVITAAQINAFIGASGPESSIWRVPGDGTPAAIWDDWSAVDWNRTAFDAKVCP